MTTTDLATAAAADLRYPASTINPAWHVRHVLTRLLRRNPGYAALLKYRYVGSYTADEIAAQYKTTPFVIALCFAALFDELALEAGCPITSPDITCRYDPWLAFRSGGAR